MCWCRPEVRTPFCGRPECHKPGDVSQKEIFLLLYEVDGYAEEGGGSKYEFVEFNSEDGLDAYVSHLTAAGIKNIRVFENLSEIRYRPVQVVTKMERED